MARKSPHGMAGLAHQLRRAVTPTPFVHGPTQWGKVHAVHSSPPSVDLYLDGVTKISTFTATKTLTKKVRVIQGYQPRVGDVGICLRGPKGRKTDRLFLGPPAGGPNTSPVRLGSSAGPPTTGTWFKGSTYLDSNDVLYVCTVGGTPGTWVKVADGGDSGWIEVTSYLHGLTGGPLYYRKQGNVVRLRGNGLAATSGAPCFVLPSGYRPVASGYFASAYEDATGYAYLYTEILLTGTVVPSYTSPVRWYLDGISFTTD